MQLRDYQQAAVMAAKNWIKYQDKAAIIDLPTGSGKSHVIAAIADWCKEEKMRVAIIAHRKELLEQNGSKLSSDFGIYSASLGGDDLESDITIAGIQSIYNKDFEPFQVILIDECFAGDTRILTNHGEKRIDRIKANDIVMTAYGEHSVESVFKKKEKNFLELRLSNGKTIRCTEDHPFFTNEGWKKAGGLEKGECLFGFQDVQKLWERDETIFSLFSKWRISPNRTRKSLGQKRMLQSILQQEIQKSNEQPCFSLKNESHFKRNSAQANKKRWEWATLTAATISIVTRLRCRMGKRGCSQDNAGASQSALSKSLQNRYSKSNLKDSYRNRWWKSYYFRANRTGQEKAKTFGTVRVESIESIKRESYEPIYNLRVAGHPSYYANGVLVHNCHRVSNKSKNKNLGETSAEGTSAEGTSAEGIGQYWQFLNASPKAKVMGFTATPYRLKGGKLSWGEVIYSVPYSLLQKQGYLCEITNKLKGKIDLSTIPLVAGDYNEALLSEYMSDPALIAEAVRNIIAYSVDREAVIIFCVTVAHAVLLTAEMQRNGLQSFSLTGSTPDAERTQVIKDFREGRLKYLLNVMVLTEGFDAPNIDMIVCLRATKSKALWIQMLGRACRTHPNKEDALLIDMSGNLEEHGGIGTPYHEKAKGEKPESKGKICPQCESFVLPTIRECPDCGFQFPEPEKRKASHSIEANMTANAVFEATETHTVKDVIYRQHTNKKTGGVSIRVDYICNVKYGSISEWLPVHSGSDWARNKAFKFFEERGHKLGNDTKEYTIDDLLWHCQHLKKPVKITVDNSKQFPEIINYEWGNSDKIEPEIEELDDFIPF